MFNIREELQNLPEQPGVYLMNDKNDTIIYVGKAKILKNRVRQYFQNSANHTPKVRAMVSNIEYFEYIVTDTEIEALALECTLIKKHRPKYNILLKDDKQYPYLKVTINEEWPKVVKTRTLRNDGAKYFGPYMGMSTIKNTMEIIRKIFMPPSCTRKFPQDIGKGRPCLNYHIKKCFAPCTGNVSNKEYRKVYFDICAFLEGDHKELLNELEARMKEASANMEFEEAAALRDKIKAITAIDEKQKVVNSDKQNDKDVIALATGEGKAFIEVFFIRAGKLSGRENYRVDEVDDMSGADIITDFIKQFYQDGVYVPDEIITQSRISDEELISQWLTGNRKKKVTVTFPQRGEKVRLVEMAAKNADIALNNYKINKLRAEDKKRAAFNTAEYLGMDKPVRIIEAYDISNISGSNNVASMVVFENGKPVRSRYRKFKIKSFEGADDYRAMQEVLYRRLNEAREETEKIESGHMNLKDAKFLPLPDVIFVDGGKGHVKAAQEMLCMTDTDIPVFGMVKDDRHRTRGLVTADGEIGINQTGSFFHMITRIQDEVHRTAITYHRDLRNKIESELDAIEGIGKTRRNALLTAFKSVDGIRNASTDELAEVDGMSKKAAEAVYNYFRKTKEK